MDDGIKSLLQSILPHMTSRRVGRLTDKSPRVAQKWFSGDMPVPEDVQDHIEDQAKILAGSTFAADLKAVVDRATAAGIHTEVIASHLAVEYRRVTGIEIE